MQSKHNKQLVPLAKQLRKEMTKEERHLWYDFLRGYPEHIYKQRIIGKYVVDFYCAAAQLVIELDGSQHYERSGLAYDVERSAYLENLDLAILRIPNNAVNENFDGVCTHINRMIQRRIRDVAAPIDPCDDF